MAGAVASQEPPEPRRYKYVVWKRGGARTKTGWVAQVPGPDGKQRIVGGVHDKQESAKACAEKVLGEAAQLSLRMPMPGAKTSRGPVVMHEVWGGPRPSSYHHVTWKQCGEIGQWLATVEGEHVGLFPAEKMAAEAAADWAGVPVKDLLKAIPLSVKLGLERFRAASALQQVCCPADIESAVQERVLSRDMFLQEPTLELLSIQGKYGPWRVAMRQQWATMPRRGPASCKSGRTEYVYDLLAATVKAVSGLDMTDWVANCGRKVSYCSGYLPLLDRLGCVEKVEGSRGQHCVKLGRLLTPYRWRAQNRANILLNLERMVAAADKLAAALTKPPRTCQQWIRVYTDVADCLDVIGAPGLTKSCSYTLPWTFRSMAIARMRACGIKRLSGVQDVSLAEFATGFPDQRGWLDRISDHHRNQHYNSLRQGSRGPGVKGSKGPPSYSALTVPGLFELTGFSGPAEQASMNFCLLSDGSLDPYPAAHFREHKLALVRQAEAYRKKHSMWPHLAVLLAGEGEDSGQGPRPKRRRVQKQ
jgi:hypothetical protein